MLDNCLILKTYLMQNGQRSYAHNGQLEFICQLSLSKEPKNMLRIYNKTIIYKFLFYGRDKCVSFERTIQLNNPHMSSKAGQIVSSRSIDNLRSLKFK